MLMSKRARTRFDELLEAAGAWNARHYSPELQEKYEAIVHGAAWNFVEQVRQDENEAREGAVDGHLVEEYDNERPF